MRKLDDILAEIEESPDGPEVAAIFDFDGTLIAGFSATLFLKEQVKRGDLSALELLELTTVVSQYSAGSLGFSGLMLASSKMMKGVTEDSYREFGEGLYEKEIAKRIYPESRAIVEAHLAKGHTVAVVSAATPYQVEPAAFDMGIKHVLCSHYEVENGEFTGEIIRPLCFGEGKVMAAEKLADETGADLDLSFFYTDSYDDIELLDRIGLPRPLNPNKKLMEVSKNRGWPVASFSSRGRPGILDYARTIAATGTMVGSFFAGLPIWALTGSRAAANNFSTSIFADISSALIGLKLDVNGEHHLWEKRPAVFMMNHQSKADVVIMASLIRRDIVGVGKQEIKDTPFIGKTMELAGTVFIDRANAASAIEAMAPLVDVMRNEGKSVVIAPEGTRTITPKLAPFKKGPFHIAIQAGVPVVPVVIHNAIDVAPKGEFVFRPATVKVDVLPPVDTTNWSAETIDDHVAEVRGMYLATLGQSDEEPSRPAKKAAQSKSDQNKSDQNKAANKKPTRKKAPTKKAPTKKAATKKGPVKKAKKTTRAKKGGNE